MNSARSQGYDPVTNTQNNPNNPNNPNNVIMQEGAHTGNVNNENILVEPTIAKEKEESRCRTVCKWIIQVIVWISLVVFVVGCIVTAYVSNRLFYVLIIGILLMFIFAIVLCVLSCKSNTYNYFQNNHEGNKMFTNYMESLFYQPIIIKFEGESWNNFATMENTSLWQKKRKNKRPCSGRHVTYTDSFQFHFLSWRDVSGPFEIDLSEYGNDSNKPFKPFLKVCLGESFEFADDGTKEDYEWLKKMFINKNKDKDQQFTFKESFYIPGLKNHNLIKLNSNTPCTYSIPCYIFSMIMLIPECFKLCFNQQSYKKNYVVKKLISTRTDLNAGEIRNTQQYINKIPSIKLGEIQQNFDDFGKYVDDQEGFLKQKTMVMVGVGVDEK